MHEQLRLLILEDRAEDAELIVAQLRAERFAPVWRRIETESELREALTESWDLIISDYQLPAFDALRAVGVVLGSAGHQPPVIVVTGTATEDIAVECIRAGADDYLLKDRPARLGSAVRRALERRDLRDQTRESAEELRASEQQFKALVESMEDVVYTLDRQGRHTGIYGRWLKREGLVPEQFLERTGTEVFGPDAADHAEAIASALRGEAVLSAWSFDGTEGTRDFQTAFSPLRDAHDRITGVVASARELTEQHRAAEAVVQVQEQVIHRLLLAAEFRDNDTGEHVARMGHLCGQIAARLGFDQPRCRSIELASVMHDVGKIGIPDNVLLKPDKLTAEEREIIEGHAEIGHRMLRGSGIDLLNLAAEIALTHHERFDGTGYPHRLAGEEIPVEGRIAAVADVFDALISDRVYRPAFEYSVALETMRKEDGRHFDPTILEALFAILEDPDVPGGTTRETVCELPRAAQSLRPVTARPTPRPRSMTPPAALRRSRRRGELPSQ